MNSKPKLALYWCSSCGGCEEAVVDLAEDVLELTQQVDIVFWPCAMDFKKTDVLSMPDHSITATLLNGAIRSSEQEEMAHLLRQKSQYLIAFGSCAQLGGIPSLANQFSREQLLRCVYEESPTTSNPTKVRPSPRFEADGHVLELPHTTNVVRSLDQVVDVDFYIPGCPPAAKVIKAAITALVQNSLPAKGSVLAPDVALCEQCPRKASKPADLSFTEFRRPHLVQLDPALCFLAQGVVCLGPATRSGCEAACIHGAMPCTGCFGPTSRVRDQGAKMIASLCGSIAGKEEQTIAQTLAGVPDPIGTFYRYGLAKSLLRRKVRLGQNSSDKVDNLPDL